jgi:hypothetical protein
MVLKAGSVKMHKPFFRKVFAMHLSRAVGWGTRSKFSGNSIIVRDIFGAKKLFTSDPDADITAKNGPTPRYTSAEMWHPVFN